MTERRDLDHRNGRIPGRSTRVLVYNGWYLIGHVDRDVPFVQELSGRGYDVTYVLAGGQAAPRGWGHPADAVDMGRLREIPKTRCTSAMQLERLISRSDLVMVGMAKGGSWIVELAQAYGKRVGMFDHSGGEPTWFDPRADFGACRGDYFKDMVLRVFPHVDPTRLTVTGSLQLDRATWPELRQSRTEFCRRYDLDPSKKIGLFLPSAPQTMDAWALDRYVRICETVRDTHGFQLVIKPHPTDYARRKARRFGGKHSWEVLTPWAIVVAPEDSYESFHQCEVAISIGSAVSYELPLFGRPFIYVDPGKWPEQLASFAATPHLMHHYPYPVPTWVGVESSIDDLHSTLATGRYKVSDPSLYEDHIARYCHKNDGLAYVRLVDLVDERVGHRQERDRLGLPARWLIKAVTRRMKRQLARLSGRA